MKSLETQLDEAVALHARAFPSDPFAAGRIRRHMERGIENPREVAKEALRLLGPQRGGGAPSKRARPR